MDGLSEHREHEKLRDGAMTLRSTATLEEYKTLRQEILNHQQVTHQINTAAFAAGTLVATAIAVSDPTKVPASIKAFMLLGAVVVFFALIRSQISRRKKMYWIGRYIQYVIERRVPGLYWESSWSRQADPKGTEERSWIENLPLLFLQLSSLIGGLYFLWQWFMDRGFPERRPYGELVLLPAALGGFLLLYEWYSIRTAEDLTAYRDKFRQLAEQIKAMEKVSALMNHLVQSHESTSHAQQQLERRVDRIDKHVGLPPFQ